MYLNNYELSMKDYSEYPKKLPLHDSYTTDRSKQKRSLFPTVSFYWNILKVVKFANGQVKRNIYNRYNWVASSLEILKVAESVGMRVEVKGMLNLSKFDGPAVIIGNHMSTLETLLLPSFIQPVKQVLYVIKKELLKFPLFGPIAAARYPIVVGRLNPREDLKLVIGEGSKHLKEGKSIIIFPQKTRTPIFDKKSFNSLGIKLAKINNVPVIPLALVTDAWGNGKYVKEVGKIDINKPVMFEFGEPLYISGNGSNQHDQVLEFIEQKLIEWGRKDLIK